MAICRKRGNTNGAARWAAVAKACNIGLVKDAKGFHIGEETEGFFHIIDICAHFSEAQIVELGMTVAFFVGFGRLAATYHMVEELPEAFQTAETIAPWGADKIQVR